MKPRVPTAYKTYAEASEKRDIDLLSTTNNAGDLGKQKGGKSFVTHHVSFDSTSLEHFCAL